MIFAVTLAKGPAWDKTQPMRSQLQWQEHARYMDRLVNERFILLGGPLNDDEDRLLAIETDSKKTLISTLEKDPWIVSGILEIKQIRTWTILLRGSI